MTKPKDTEIHNATVYDLYMRNSSGKDSYLMQIAYNTTYLENGTHQASVEGDGYKYFKDENQTITLVSDKRTLILKLIGSVK